MDDETLALLQGLGIDPAGFQQEQAPVIGGIAPPTLQLGDPRVNELLSTDTVTEIYRQGDEVAIFQSLPLEFRVRLQDTLVSLGLTRNVMRGEMDDATINGMGSLLSLSNRAGTSWRQTIGRLEQLQEEGLLDGADASKIEPYRPPDYATLAQTAKNAVRQSLGRDPTQAELGLMADELGGFYRQAYDSDVAALGDRAAGREVSAPQVDVAARFNEAFESRFAGQIQQAETEDSVRQVAGETQAQLGRV